MADPESWRQVQREYDLLESQMQMQIQNVLTRIQSNFSREKFNLSAENNHWKDENSSAIKRNERFLKELELRKAKLRSLHCYQPASGHFSHLLKEFTMKNNDEKKRRDGNRHEPRT